MRGKGHKDGNWQRKPQAVRFTTQKPLTQTWVPQALPDKMRFTHYIQ